LNTVNEGGEVTLEGRLFHARTAFMWNKWSQIEQSQCQCQCQSWIYI